MTPKGTMNYGNSQFVSGVSFIEIVFFVTLFDFLPYRVHIVKTLFVVPMAPGEGERVFYLSDVSLSDPSVEV